LTVDILAIGAPTDRAAGPIRSPPVNRERRHIYLRGGKLEGDLVFYLSRGRWWERLICKITRGPYVHVGIVVPSGQVLCARARRGICYEKFPAQRWDMYFLARRATTEGISQGLEWATSCAGQSYGWSDILWQALKFLWPRNPLRWGIAGHYDCSDFAARYLIHCGVVLPDGMDDTYTVSPNDLARWAGLI
jgi:hypothetical protein